MCLECSQNVLKGLQRMFMELLYVKKVHVYFEIFQKSLNSQIASKTAKWIWKIEIEKTFGEKEPFSILGHFWPNSLPLFYWRSLTVAQPTSLGRRLLPPGREAARCRCCLHPMPPPPIVAPR
jgi:hypothetical protein